VVLDACVGMWVAIPCILIADFGSKKIEYLEEGEFDHLTPF